MNDIEVLNKLKEYTCFKNFRELCDVLEFKYDTKHTYINENNLSLYCKWHKQNNIIYIDEVFNKRNKTKYDYKYDINDIVQTKYGAIKILKCYKKKWENDHFHKTYLCECLKDKYVFELREHHIVQGVGCPICGDRSAVLGYNTIFDTRKDLLKYFVNIDDAKICTSGGDNKLLVKCPKCGNLKYVIASNLCRTGFSCEKCGDGISYPNKFIRNFLDQLDIEYYSEKTFIWSNNRIYDQYIPKYNCIIEAHGKQHYEECSLTSRTLSEEIENDYNKKIMALNNQIENYIVIDCRKSDMEWIKKSIMESNLPDIFKFKSNDINWNKCNEYALNPIVKEVCIKWNELQSITKTADYYCMDKHTIIDYLNKGSLCGFCNYKKGDRINVGKNISDAKKKPVYCKELNLYFLSQVECEQYFKEHDDLKFNGKTLYTYINNQKKYHGYTFQYVNKDTYNKIIKENA